MKALALVTLVAIVAWAAVKSAARAEGAAPVIKIEIETGQISGVEHGAVNAYLGVPYAAPPVGGLRLRPPAPAKPWRGVRPADQFGPDCLAPTKLSPPQSEDCLYLNIWTPAAPAPRPRPVMVWIFGSGFRSGSAATPTYSGEGLAQKGVIFVNFNYRMGALGFLAHPSLSAESPRHASGNYGLLDAVAALGWVKRNIAKFGGDPDDVTIFGQSSGSETTNILTASPLARGEFQRAIGESGAAFGEREPKLLADAERSGADFTAKLGATTAEQLRALPAAAFVQGDPPRFEPVVDGWVLPKDVYDIYAEGRQNDVPMLVGSNADEGQRPKGLTAQAYVDGVKAKYGSKAQAYLALFPAGGDAEAADARKSGMTALLGDFNSSTWATLQSRTGRSPIFQYRFEHAPPPRIDVATPSASPSPQPSSFQPQGVFHGAEIPYALNNLDRAPARAWTPQDRRLADTLSDIWVAFAKTGRPAGAGIAWPAVKDPDPQVLRISETLTVEPRRTGGLLAGLSAFFYGANGLYGERTPKGWIPASEGAGK